MIFMKAFGPLFIHIFDTSLEFKAVTDHWSLFSFNNTAFHDEEMFPCLTGLDGTVSQGLLCSSLKRCFPFCRNVALQNAQLYGGLKKKPAFLECSASVDSDSTSTKQTPGIQRKQQKRRKSPSLPRTACWGQVVAVLVRHTPHRLTGCGEVGQSLLGSSDPGSATH